MDGFYDMCHVGPARAGLSLLAALVSHRRATRCGLRWGSRYPGQSLNVLTREPQANQLTRLNTATPDAPLERIWGVSTALGSSWGESAA